MARARRSPVTAPPEKLGPRFPRLAALAERVSLPGLESWSTNVRTVLLNGLFLLAAIVILPLLVGQFRRDEVIIEPIAVPEILATQGLTADVVASRIWDGLLDVKETARTAKESIAALPGSRRVEFSFPDSGFSIESLVFHTRKLFGAYETRVAGEFVCADAECARDGMQLRLRIVRDTVVLVDLPPIGDRPERAYFGDAAAGVLAELDPFVAIAALQATEPLKAAVLARRLIRAHQKDAKWAHNLIGNIRSDAEEWPAAIAEYRAALDLDPGFALARSNLANVLRITGDLDGAEREFGELARVEPKSVRLAEGLADLALARGDRKAATAHLLEAAERDPLSPRYLARAGQIAIEDGDTANGGAYLARALEIDPGDPLAFAVLAAKHLTAGDLDKAERIYRDAADYAPNDAGAQMSHGRVLAMAGKWELANARLARAVELDPVSVDYKRQLAESFVRLGRPVEAEPLLREALVAEPKNAELHIGLANSLRDQGRNPEAIAEYKAFLEFELDTKAPMRDIAQRYVEFLAE